MELLIRKRTLTDAPATDTRNTTGRDPHAHSLLPHSSQPRPPAHARRVRAVGVSRLEPLAGAAAVRLQRAPGTVFQLPSELLHRAARGRVAAGRARRCPGLFSESVSD